MNFISAATVARSGWIVPSSVPTCNFQIASETTELTRLIGAASDRSAIVNVWYLMPTEPILFAPPDVLRGNGQLPATSIPYNFESDIHEMIEGSARSC